MDTEKRTNISQMVLAVAGLLVTALLGYGQWQIGAQQNEMAKEQRRIEETRAKEAQARDKERAADEARVARERNADAIEVQVMSLVAPRFTELRGTGPNAETAREVVQAAAEYLSGQYQRTGLANMYQRIIATNTSLTVAERTRSVESTAPGSETAQWYAVLASLPGDDLAGARARADSLLVKARSAGMPQIVQLYKTKISNNYAVIIGGPLSRPDAQALTVEARQKNLAGDAFAQQDRSWKLIWSSPPEAQH